MFRIFILFIFFTDCRVNKTLTEEYLPPYTENIPMELEPPGPWEPYSAILTADIISLATFAKQPIWNKGLSECTVNAKVKEILVQQNKAKDPNIVDMQILLPLSTAMGEADELIKQDELPAFFRETPNFIAALVYDEKLNLYKASSYWAYLSFFKPSNEARSFIESIRKKAIFTKADALEIGQKKLKATDLQLAIDVIGGKINNGKFVQTYDPTEKGIQLVWRIINVNNRNEYIFVSLSDGEIVQVTH